MKLPYKDHDELCVVLDRLIIFYKKGGQKLPRITLNSKQFQIFKEFNQPKNNVYFYKTIPIRQDNVR